MTEAVKTVDKELTRPPISELTDKQTKLEQAIEVAAKLGISPAEAKRIRRTGTATLTGFAKEAKEGSEEAYKKLADFVKVYREFIKAKLNKFGTKYPATGSKSWFAPGKCAAGSIPGTESQRFTSSQKRAIAAIGFMHGDHRFCTKPVAPESEADAIRPWTPDHVPVVSISEAAKADLILASILDEEMIPRMSDFKLFPSLAVSNTAQGGEANSLLLMVAKYSPLAKALEDVSKGR